MSLPCAYTALPYSSTATLTMLATRRAGCSWARAAETARQQAPSSAICLRILESVIAEQIYRDSSGLATTPRLSKPLRDHVRCAHVLGMRQGQGNASHRQLC